MNKRNFKVGDKVRIRQWDDMAKEYGINSQGHIEPSHTSVLFNKSMKHLCGITAKIKFIDSRRINLDFGYKVSCTNWNYQPYMFEPIENETIVIYRKGKEVIALDKATGKKAVAKCCPDDEFDFNTGAKLAFDRLLGIEQPKYKEVKRHPKKGEYVKVLSEDGHHLKIGYITQYIRPAFDNGWIWVKGIRNDTVLRKEQYVVLEGYEPPKEEKKECFFNGKVVCVKANNNFVTQGKVYEFKDGYAKNDKGNRMPYLTKVKSVKHLNEILYSDFIEIVE